MTVRNLQYLLHPKSVALIGASATQGAVGEVLARNLLEFKGELYFVNPRHESIHGRQCWPDAKSLPAAPELAVICTPAVTVPDLVKALGERGTRAVVVISAGFGEGDGNGRKLQQALLDAAQPYTLRVVGPNCIGVLNPPLGLNASFAPASAPAGRLAFITQSGALLSAVLDWARPRGIGFSHMLSLGDMADVDFGDLLDWLATDPGTQAVLLYIEGIRHARKFMSAARAAARLKPVVVVKGGRHAEGARAAATHTGALAGSDRVYDAAIRRAGMLRVPHLGALFGAADILTSAVQPQGRRLGILTNGGGLGVLATDALLDRSGELAALSAATLAALDAALPPTWSHGNPVDIIGDAKGPRYRAALAALAKDSGLDALLVLYCPTGVSDPLETAEAVIAASRTADAKPLLASWAGGETVAKARAALAAARVPSYDTPEAATQAFMYLADYRRNQEMLSETPPALPEALAPDTTRAREIVAAALTAGREWLTEIESKSLLECYAIPTVPTRFAATPEDAARLARELPAPYVLKIVSPEITHKSDVGGVVLGIASTEAVAAAARDMQGRIAAEHPEATLSGFAVQPMVQRRQAHELIAGIGSDAQFGPVILFGQGGTSAEVVGDTALGLPPLNLHLAEMLIQQTRVARLLAGYRDRPAANRTAIALTLVKLATLAAELAEVAELDINPLLADSAGVVALDARVRLMPAVAPGEARLAIRPYPRELEQEFPIAGHQTLRLRPILPEDEAALQRLFALLTPEEIYLRFMRSMRILPRTLAIRLTQIDYEREMTWVLSDPGLPGETDLHALAQVVADPDLERAEFALLVRHDLAGRGLGTRLMQVLMDYARARGIRILTGIVLRENAAMLDLCHRLGFKLDSPADEPDIVRASFDFAAPR